MPTIGNNRGRLQMRYRETSTFRKNKRHLKIKNRVRHIDGVLLIYI